MGTPTRSSKEWLEDCQALYKREDVGEDEYHGHNSDMLVHLIGQMEALNSRFNELEGRLHDLQCSIDKNCG